MKNLASGLRHQGANSDADCNPRTNAKSKVANRDANSASNRYAKTNPSAHEFAVFFVRGIAHGILYFEVDGPVPADLGRSA
jgi:hypothetical protein